MKVLDVNPFHAGIKSNLVMLSNLQTRMRKIETTVDGLVAMEDSLKGQGGNSIRSFYRACHLPLLNYFIIVKSDLESTLNTMDQALDGLEPANDGFIQQVFLEEEIEAGLKGISQLTGSLTDEANGIMDQVGDIVTLPHLNDSDVQEAIQDARKKRDNTVTDLFEFDASQTSALLSFEGDLVTLTAWISDLEGVFTEGVTDVNFPTDQWAALTKQNMLETDLAQRTAVVDRVESDKKVEEVEDITSTEYSTARKVQLGKEGLDYGVAGFTGIQRSAALGDLERNNGLMTIKTDANKTKGIQTSYRTNITQTGLKDLGIEADANANKAFNQTPKNKGTPKSHWKLETQMKYLQKAPLNYLDKHGNQVWSGIGKQAVEKFPEIKLLNHKAGVVEKAKNIVKFTGKGVGDSFKDIVDVKGIANSGLVKGGVKALGPLGTGVNFINNYQEAKEEGMGSKKATAKATVDTAIDTAAASGVQAAAIAIATVAIPIPFVGTAVGVAAGIYLNTLLFKRTKKKGVKEIKDSKIDKLKGLIKW